VLGGQSASVVYRFRTRGGDYRWLETLTRPILDADGRVEQLQSASRDISETVRIRQQLEYDALHDALTGLANRSLLAERLQFALDRLHRFCGYSVVSDNHLGDWGTQFGLIILGYRHFLNEQALDDSPVEELERIYVKSYEASREDPEWLESARQELVKLQHGDPENLELWKRFVELSLSEFHKVFARLDVSCDLERGESYYRDDLAFVLERLKAKGLLEESEGAQVVNLEEEGLGVCIVQKRD